MDASSTSYGIDYCFHTWVYGPGDPIEVQLGNNYDEANAERIREKMGLNDPVIVQWMSI